MSQDPSLISLAQAKLVVQHLENNNVASANDIIHTLMLKESDELFSEVGMLTRQLHDSLSSFQLEYRLNGLTNNDMPDARSGLEYVIVETEKAANATMDAIERSMPIADQLNDRLASIMPEWKKLMNRQIELGDFKHLCITLDQLLTDAAADSKALNKMLTEVLLVQGYQDLTGQVIRRVIELVKEVEDHLVAVLASFGEQDPQKNVQKNLHKEKSPALTKSGDNMKAEGPIIDAATRDDVVSNQDDVDDLLSSLGFKERKMSFEVDEEIMQDFLVEAGEILEQLQEQLVELENNPENAELLNAIFRGYHTVKGGAGFLALTELVEICHGAENVFDVMRNGQRALSSELMDVILQATDVVVEMFEQVKARDPLIAAPASLIEILHKLSRPEQAGEVIFQGAENKVRAHTDTPTVSAVHDDINEINEDEFEALLDELHGARTPSINKSEKDKPKPNDKTTAGDNADASNNDISDDEFESLLDELHGKGSFRTDTAAPKSHSTATNTAKVDDDEISDDEFEALLDNLHGKGKAPAIAKPGGNTNAQSASTAKTVGATQVAAKSTKPEAKLAPVQAETTVRVDTKRLDQIMNMVGELVLVRNRLISLGATLADESMSKAIANLDVVTGDLQGAVMKTRMQPIKKVFGRFPRVVRDLARTLKKEITLVLEGEDTDLDKNLVEALADPLVHLVRNSVDHGIEMPNEREAAGKSRMGTVKLAASQEGDHILLTIFDDGKGMDAEKLKEIAINRGVLDAEAAARMSDEEAFSLIFAPGFSTKTEISEVSGRGVGMDVVKTKINQLNGTVNISSSMGEGTTLYIKVPLTLAILPTLMIVVAQQTFALPLGAVNEIINMDIGKTNTVDNQLTMIVRSKAIPLFYLNDWLNPHKPIQDRTKGHVVVVKIGTQQLGFVVDSLIGQEEVVIKPLDSLLQGTAGMAGATITSDGGIALILDIPSLVKRHV